MYRSKLKGILAVVLLLLIISCCPNLVTAKGFLRTLGQDILNSQCVQTVVPQSTWQGCFLSEGGEFALMGCTVTPGLEFVDYESGCRDKLLEQYPNEHDLIVRLTREE